MSMKLIVNPQEHDTIGTSWNGLRYFTEDSTRARNWERRTQPRVDLTNAELFSTLPTRVGHTTSAPSQPIKRPAKLRASRRSEPE